MTDISALQSALARISGGERISGVTRRDDGDVGFVLAVDGLSADESSALRARAEAAARSVPGVGKVRVILTAERSAAPYKRPAAPAPTKSAADPHPVAAAELPNIRRIIAVASGKGGVGKSTVAANLAVALARQGLRVGLLDADIYGPSVPTLFGLTGKPELKDKRIQPMEAYGIATMSMGMMIDPDRATIWRGPMASSAMMQLLTETDWGERDVLIVDLPPGTGDIQLTMAQKMPVFGAVIVSTPQDLALIDAKRAIAMFGQVKIPVLGVVENMSVFVCPNCGTSHAIFGTGGAEETARAINVPFLGAIPLDAAIRFASDSGTPPATGDGPQADAYRALAEKLTPLLEL